MRNVKKGFAWILALALCLSLWTVPAMAEEKKVIYSENFDSLADDAAAKEALKGFWHMEIADAWPQDSSNGGFSLTENGGGKALHMKWLNGRRLLLATPYIPGNYEVAFQAKSSATTPNGGFFFLHTLSRTPTITQAYDKDKGVVDLNPAQYVDVFEDDGCKADDIGFGVGYAGIYLKLDGTRLEIGVKTAEEISEIYQKGIGNLRYFADLPEGKDFRNDLLQIRVTESNRKVSVYVEDTLLAAVEYSEIKGDYFTKAAIQDASGKIVKTTENARIATVDNVIGFSTRGGDLVLDNFEVLSLDGFVPIAAGIKKLFDDSKDKSGALGILGDSSVAVRIDIASGQAMNSFTYCGMPTYSARNTEFTFSVYRWNQDYDTTVKGTPVYQTVKFNHTDNQDCIFYFPDPIQAGTYLIVMSNGKAGVDSTGNPNGQPAVWTHTKAADSSAVFYSNGEEADFAIFAQYSLLDGYPVIPDTEPTPTVPATGDFGLAALAVAAVSAIGGLKKRRNVKR